MGTGLKLIASREDFYRDDPEGNYITLLDYRHPLHEWIDELTGTNGYYSHTFLLTKIESIIRSIMRFNSPVLSYTFQILDGPVGEISVEMQDGLFNVPVYFFFDPELEAEGYDNGIQAIVSFYLHGELYSGVEGTFGSIMEKLEEKNNLNEFFDI